MIGNKGCRLSGSCLRSMLCCCERNYATSLAALVAAGGGPAPSIAALQVPDAESCSGVLPGLRQVPPAAPHHHMAVLLVLVVPLLVAGVGTSSG